MPAGHEMDWAYSTGPEANMGQRGPTSFVPQTQTHHKK